MKKHSISKICVFLGFTRDAYYKSVKQSEKAELREEVLTDAIRSIRMEHPRMGGRKLYYLTHELSKELRIGRDKFFDILRTRSLLVERKKSYTKTTDSYHRFRVYKNELRVSEIREPNRAWASDITYIRTSHGFAYLFLITDVYSRKTVGWELSKSLSLEGCVAALQKALKQCPRPEGVIHHSDRGIQYCSNVYVSLLRKNRMRISMTEENHCYENAMAERVNGILKDEYLLNSTFKDFNMAKKACLQAINAYNTKRPHWSLGLKTPEEVHGAAA